MNEIQLPFEQVGTLPIYAVLARSDGFHLLTTGTADAYSADHWPAYAIALVPSTDDQFIQCSVPPTAPSGTYTITLFEQAGASPATTDTDIASASLEWRGSVPVVTSDTNAFLADAIAGVTGPGSELVTYTQDGVARQIRVMVDRAGIVINQQFAGFGMSLLMANDAAAGMATVKQNKDTVTIAPRIGGTPKSYTVVDILPDSDPYAWHLQINVK